MKKIPILFLLCSTFNLQPTTCLAAEYAVRGERYLREYTAPRKTMVYNAETEAARIARNLCNVPWKASNVSDATTPSHAEAQLDDNVNNREGFDAALFCAYHTNNTHRAYANAACYVIEFPEGPLPKLTELSLDVYSDPYNAAGARIALLPSDTPVIPTDCATCRGENEGGIKATNVAPRITRRSGNQDNWYPNSTNLVFTTNQLGSAGLQLKRYLFVFVLLEHYDMSRGNWLEGSSYIDNDIRLTTDAEIPDWSVTCDIAEPYATLYNLKDGHANDDDDGDGLSNYSEYLISEVFKFAKLDPKNPKTDASCRDFFRKAGDLYFGEVFEHMQKPCFNPEFETMKLPIAATIIYNDALHSGKTAPVIIQVYDETIDPDMTGNPLATFETDPFDITGTNVKLAECDIRARTRTGPVKITVFADINGDGKFNPEICEPFAFVQNVTRGTKRTAFTACLTDQSTVFSRIDLLATGNASDSQWMNRPDFGVSCIDATKNDATSVYYRGKIAQIGFYPAASAPSKDGVLRVRVVRALVDGDYNLGKASDRTTDIPVGKAVVMDKYLDLNARSYLHEGDFLVVGAHDVGWYGLRDNVFEREVYNPTGVTPATKFIVGSNVTYAVVLGEEHVSGYGNSSNTVFRLLVNKNYDLVGTRLVDFTNAIKPRIDATTPGIVYGARPTFRWLMQDAMGVSYESYMAFEVQIRSKNGTVLYTSGVRDVQIASRDATGVTYEWTLDRSLESVIGTTCGEYTWRVAMYNAKYKNNTYRGYTVTQWSDDGSLVVDLNRQQPMNDHGYSSIAASVKYAGPPAVLAAEPEPKVYLQAYETADFSGLPVAEAFVTDFTELSNTTHVVTNACLHGVSNNGTYYLKAFIDSNGNGIQDDFESWGEANRYIELTPETTRIPTVGIYIEDSDTDGDWIPDAYEYAQCDDLTTINGKVIGGDRIRFIGEIATAVDKAGVSKGLSGASLTLFQNGSFARLVSPNLTATVSLDDIRIAVDRKLYPTTVVISAYSLAGSGSCVSLHQNDCVTDYIAGSLFYETFYAPTSLTAHVDVKIYKKNTLAESGWTLFRTVSNVSVSRGSNTIDVPVSGIDMTDGFYKIEIVEH